MNYILYTIDGCSKCHMARKHLLEENIPFLEINILKNPSAAIQLKKKMKEVIAPVLVSDDRIIVGSDILLMKGEIR
ncbi:hypothetical protein NP92_08540 [Anoxybacillus gonensis]|uniref:Glutaredoxin family protein n=1 Tax=Anoxybacillus gonensis TaxID=198467 RepID=A0AAW7TEG2_9BACL|nr:glutaredoxin family protein [Anoxybacillus gonensis]AKS38369.1 hypothetical protein AFK25_07330 [Anoxybacillus gonensis]KGP60461.1 hypothetical protein NP92_08540 [Anoxybacillus gonensis]MCX8046320.1 glutaredoxin family protein [Anoxybacillus gonensis]MDO0877738.1 glutaredoxin family protein [Anoxybacillus gonensis]